MVKVEAARHFDVIKENAVDVISEPELLAKLEDSLKSKNPLKLKIGFDPKYLPQKNIDKEFSPNIAYYIIKDLIFGLDPKTDEVIIIPNKKVNDEK